jgi:signal transduction histidine kinase
MAQLGQGWTEAVEFNRLRSEWLGKVVHDIRSPLSTIIAGLASFEEGLFGDMLPEQVEWIIKMRRTALHIAKLTEDFFDFTKLELGKLQLYYEGTNLNTYLEEIYQVGRALPWSSRVEFKLELELNLPSIPLDPTRIQQVIINLVSNALKFTEKGEVTLFAHTRHDIGMVIIGVRDTGVGIPPEEIPNMFQRFYQTGSAAMRRKGTGLGLAICRELVELHQGYITLTSKLHQGSTFQFALPIDPDLEKYLEKF